MTMRKIPTFFWEFPNHTPPQFDLSNYLLRVGGAVECPLELSLSAIRDLLPNINLSRRFYCVNGWSLEANWGGFYLKDLLLAVRANPSSRFLRSTSLGGYEDTTAIDILTAGGAMLVTHMNGEPLSAKRGRPMRLIQFNQYQFKGVKALASIEVVDEYRPGTWQKYGYVDGTIQPYPHLAIDSNEELMPTSDVLGMSDGQDA